MKSCLAVDAKCFTMEDTSKKKKKEYQHKSGLEKWKQALKVSLEKAAADPKQKNLFQLLQPKKSLPGNYYFLFRSFHFEF